MRRSILFVEDERVDVKLMLQALSEVNFTESIHVASNATEAIAYLSGEAEYADRAAYPFPRFILLDLALPGESGFSVLEKIRTHEDWRRLPIIVLTGSSDQADVDRAYDMGASSYILKPDGREELVALARHLQLYWTLLNRPPSPSQSGGAPC